MNSISAIFYYVVLLVTPTTLLTIGVAVSGRSAEPPYLSELVVLVSRPKDLNAIP